MEFWLIEDGEKAGPYQAYQIRQRIEAGELGPETQGWHRDQEGWRSLKDIDLFTSEFNKPPPVIAVPPPLPKLSATLGGAIVRFLARWVDVLLYQLIILVALKLAGINFLIAGGPLWFFVVFVIPLLVLEGFCLAIWQKTPGKWLGDLRVSNEEGENLGWGVTTLRAFRVYVMGLGMLFHPLLSIACQAFGLWFLLKKGCALWDLRVGTVVRLSQIRIERILLLCLTVGALVIGNGIFVMSALMGAVDHLPPELRKDVEEFRELWEQTKSGGAADS